MHLQTWTYGFLHILTPENRQKNLKTATWFLWLFFHLGIKQHLNPRARIFLLQIGSTDNCEARRWVWERGFLVTQGEKKNKGMSPGLPNSWLNFRAWLKAVLRLVYWQQKKLLPLGLPFFLHCSPSTNTPERAPCSKIKTSLLTWVKKQRVF